MIQKISISIFALVAFLTMFPNSTQAYFTTKQTAVKVTDTTALYTITYEFGPMLHNTRMPVATMRDLMHGESERLLGYTIRNDEGEENHTGDTAAIVFSNADLVNNMYLIEAGETVTFTLVTFFRVDESTEVGDYALQVENLPFPTIINTADVSRSLNPSELKYYVSPTVELGS